VTVPGAVPHPSHERSWPSGRACGRLRDVLATVSFFYGHRDPVSVTAG
jgi:hypothetical protein